VLESTKMQSGEPGGEAMLKRCGRESKRPAWTRSWLPLGLPLMALSLGGCSPPRPGPVVGYTGVIRSAGSIPGQPGRFRLRVRVTRLDGKTDFALPPTISVEELSPTPAPPLAYSERIIRFTGKNFCEFSLRGRLAPPTLRTTTLAVSLYRSRQVPAWRRFVLSPNPISEISARSPVGTFVVPGVTPATGKTK
jgi:hypothetical protein